MDILGFAKGSYQAGDSLPGNITLSPGGVAHNIALRLTQMGETVQLLTVLGDDLFADVLKVACIKTGIGLTYTVKVSGPSSTYLAIHNQEGDMVAAVNQMDALASLTPVMLVHQLSKLSQAFAACVLDANLSVDCLQAAAQALSIPLVADPVSAAKCRRLLPVMDKLYAIKPNLMEAEALTGERDPEKAAQALLSMGVRQAFISLGSKGVYYAEQNQQGILPAPPLPHVGLTGAGDAMTAGITKGVMLGLDARQTAQMGIDSSYQYLSGKLNNENKETT